MMIFPPQIDSVTVRETGELGKLGKITRFIAYFIGGAISLGLARSLAASSGYVLGAIPTVLIIAPWLYAISRISRRRISQSEMILRLKAMIDDPNTSQDLRERAAERLSQFEQTSR